jgi:hypothetical protein
MNSSIWMFPAGVSRARLLVPAAAFGVMLSGVAASTAWAQFAPPNAPPGAGNIATGRRSAAQNPADKPEAPAPDAIPGAKARTPVAPATRADTDLAPDDALFDAINRGDIVAARDALNRGAELNEVNILGMTPMELSVDLGRNDISFLLLSMRGEDAGRGSRTVAQAAPPLKNILPAKRTTVAKSSGPLKPIPVATKPMATPKLFANDGGAPQPSAGFLGFGARSATN